MPRGYKHPMKRLAVVLVVTIALTGCNARQQGAAQDQGLAAAVSAKLATVDVNAATAVHVSVQNGVATLSGQAQSIGEQQRYDAAARSVSGITSVDDRLTVNPHLQGIRQKTRDAALAVRVSSAIAAQAGVNVFHVTPSVRRGVVTLRGSVPRDSVRKTIVSTVQKIPGVTSVVDDLRLSP